jgi:glycosyltransferase involved in cell wall biosynthesis
MNTQLKYSVVVPVYNEKETVKNLHQEIVATMNSISYPYEIIFVDDGSTDKTYEILSQLSSIKIIRFRKNFGQTAALDCGIKQARGEVIITLDGDGQNPPFEIPKLLKKLDEGYDLVSGWRYNRKDPFSKKIISQWAEILRKFLVKDEIHDSGCTLKVYKKDCFKNLDLYGEIHRFIPAILKWRGFKVGEAKVEHRERNFGKSKYNYKRILKGFLDMWSVWFWRKYASRPLHLFGGLGVVMGSLGSLLLLYFGVGRLLGLLTLTNRIWPLIAVFLILVGLQLFIFGILADILAKTYYKDGQKPYFVKDIIERK